METQITLTLTNDELDQLIDTLDKRADFFFGRLESTKFDSGPGADERRALRKQNLDIVESLLSKIRAAENLSLMRDDRAA